MPQEFSCGAVVFRRDKGIKFLILHYGKGHWDFPKGHTEKGESAQETAVRETREETGINDPEFIGGFREEIGYFFRQYGKLVHKEVIYFLAETKTIEVKLSFEHTGFEWLAFEEAWTKVTFKSSREILKKAGAFLRKRDGTNEN